MLRSRARIDSGYNVLTCTMEDSNLVQREVYVLLHGHVHMYTLALQKPLYHTYTLVKRQICNLTIVL